MAVFAYRAFDRTASVVQGTISADSPRGARDALRAQGYDVEHVGECRPAAKGKHLFHRLNPRFGKRYGSKVTAMCRELATLIGVGVPLLEALETIARQHRHGSFGTIILRLRERVAAGISLADGMAEQPAVFDETCACIVRVGEDTGSLDDALQRLASFRERASAFRSRLSTALIYPAVVLAMALGVSVFLMTTVVPRLLEGLIADGRPLPLATQLVKGMSDFLLGEWWIILPAAAAVAIAFALILRSPRGLRLFHRVQLRLPILGELKLKQEMVRISTVLTALLRSGIEFVAALEIAEKTSGNVVLRDALASGRTAITAGADIGDALGASGVLPPLVVQVFALGQQSGRLEEMLERLATDYDAQVATAAQRLTAVLEPLLILFLVVVVGFIAFATVLPMLEAADAF